MEWKRGRSGPVTFFEALQWAFAGTGKERDECPLLHRINSLDLVQRMRVIESAGLLSSGQPTR